MLCCKCVAESLFVAAVGLFPARRVASRLEHNGSSAAVKLRVAPERA